MLKGRSLPLYSEVPVLRSNNSEWPRLGWAGEGLQVTRGWHDCNGHEAIQNWTGGNPGRSGGASAGEGGVLQPLCGKSRSSWLWLRVKRRHIRSRPTGSPARVRCFSTASLMAAAAVLEATTCCSTDVTMTSQTSARSAPTCFHCKRFASPTEAVARHRVSELGVCPDAFGPRVRAQKRSRSPEQSNYGVNFWVATVRIP